MVTGFGAVILVTHDADRMAEFYRMVLGIELEPRLHDGASLLHYAGDLGGITFSIHHDNWRQSPETGPGGRDSFNTTTLMVASLYCGTNRSSSKDQLILPAGAWSFFATPMET
jgi:catechol-2,3-dioxygenase